MFKFIKFIGLSEQSGVRRKHWLPHLATDRSKTCSAKHKTTTCSVIPHAAALAKTQIDREKRKQFSNDSFFFFGENLNRPSKKVFHYFHKKIAMASVKTHMIQLKFLGSWCPPDSLCLSPRSYTIKTLVE